MTEYLLGIATGVGLTLLVLNYAKIKATIDAARKKGP